MSRFILGLLGIQLTWHPMTTPGRGPKGWVVMRRLYRCPPPFLLFLFLLLPLSLSSLHADNGVKTCTVTQGYRVTGFGGARCSLKFPCSIRLAKFSVQAFLHYRHGGCIVDVFAAAAHRPSPTPPMYRLPERLRPRAVWVQLKLLSLDRWETLNLDLMTSDLRRGENFTAFEFVSSASLPTPKSLVGGGIQRNVFQWRGIKVMTSSGTDVTPAVMSLPQFRVTVRFRPLSLDLLMQNLTLLNEPAIVIEAPKGARIEDRVYATGPYASYSVCGTLQDDDRFWGLVRDRGYGETRVQACIRFAVCSHSEPLKPRLPGFDEGECQHCLANLLQSEKRYLALLACSPLLHRPLLLRCLHNTLTKRHNPGATTNPPEQTSPTSNAAENPDGDDDGDNYFNFSYRLFRSCLRFVCTGDAAFCHMVRWQRGKATRGSVAIPSPHGKATSSLLPRGSSSSVEDGVTWACGHLFDPLLREGLRHGCDDDAANGSSTMSYFDRLSDVRRSDEEGVSSS